jgi:septal ring factor EnvC (AmiA/AmiB activator)
MDVANVAAILIALIALIPSVLVYARERRKTQAEAADIVTGAAVDLVKQLKTEVAELRAHVGSLEADVARLKAENAQLKAGLEDLRRGARRLQGQIEALGQPPVWTVPAESREMG